MGKTGRSLFANYEVVNIDDLRIEEIEAAERADADDGWNYGYVADYPADVLHCESELCREPRNGPFVEVEGFLICEFCLAQELGDDEPIYVLFRDS